MANPQPDQFTRISNELYRAIMQTDFTKRQRNILDLVIRMSYGCGKKSALLRPVDFELVGIYKTHIRKELNYLSKAAVLIIDGDRISLNKDYDQWRISLSKSAINTNRWSKVLSRNLNDEVTETVTKDDDKVTKTVTGGYQNSNQAVTKTVTKGYQNSNQAVTKTVTRQGRKPSSTKGYETPKESSKDIKEKVKERGEGLPPHTPLKPESIEDVLTEFPRYSNEQLMLIREYWDTIRFTRKTGNVAYSIVQREMQYWERFPVEIVLEALDIHIRRYQTKREDYTRGIMRRLGREKMQKGMVNLGRASPAEKDYTLRLEPEPERDYTRGLPGY